MKPSVARADFAGIPGQLSAPRIRVGNSSVMRWSCRIGLSHLLDAVHRTAGGVWPPVAHRQQCRKSQLELHGRWHRQAHVQVTSKGREGEKEIRKGKLHEASRRRRGRRPPRKEAVEGASFESLGTSSISSSHRQQAVFSPLLRTSRTELEHMKQASASGQPPLAADEQRKYNRPQRESRRAGAAAKLKKDASRGPPRGKRPRRASPLPGTSESQHETVSRMHSRHENALSTGREVNPRLKTGQGNVSQVKPHRILPDWLQYCADWLWVPSWPAVPQGQLSAATSTKQLQQARVECDWHGDDTAPNQGTGSQRCAVSGGSLQQLHAIAVVAQPVGSHTISPALQSVLLDQCIRQVQREQLADGVAMQVVNDAVSLASMMRRLRTSDWQEMMLSKLQALMVNAACKSLDEHRYQAVVPGASGSLPVPSRSLYHGLRLSVTLAEAGTTSAEYVEAVSKLLRKEVEQLAAAPGTPVSLAMVTSIMQALAHSGSSSRDAQCARVMTAAACDAAIFTGLCNIRQQHRSQLPTLTVWDWTRFYAPVMGLLRGAYAAMHYPAPLLHMQGLNVQHKGDRVMSQFSLPGAIDKVLPATSHRVPGVPWRTFAAVGQRDPVDTLVLLLHSFLVSHFSQTGLGKSLASLDPESFRQQYKSAFSTSDVHFMRQVYAGLHALSSMGNARTVYPQKLMLADCISRTLGILQGRAGHLDKDLLSESHLEWENQILTRNTHRALRRRHEGRVLDQLKLLGRVSMSMPSLRQRLFSSSTAVAATKTDPVLHTAIQDVREKLLEEFDENTNDNETCRWLALKLSTAGPTVLIFQMLRTALLADSDHLCARLKRVPDSVVSIFRCLSNPQLREHRTLLDGALKHIPDTACNRDVAQALHDAALKAPVHQFVEVMNCIQIVSLLVNTLEAIHELHAQPAHAAEAIAKMRKVTCLYDTMRTVGDTDVEQLKDRVCQTIPASTMISAALLRILGPYRPEKEPQHVGAIQQAVEEPQGWVEDVREVLMKAGSGEAVKGCRVTAELAAQSSLSSDVKIDHEHLPDDLEKYCARTLYKVQGRPSELQKRVHLALQKLGYPVHSERSVRGLPLIVDVLTRGFDSNGAERDIVLEVDGPSHFLYSPDAPPQLCPGDELKAASLLLQGVLVIRVSYKDWDRIAVSGRGLLHGELQVSWLQNELEHQGIVGPATIPSGNSPELWSPER